MILVIRPLLARIFGSEEPWKDTVVAMSVIFALLSGAATEFLGIHLLFGAFLAGAVMPRKPDLIQHLIDRLETLTNVLLLPVFFAYAGLRTHIELIQHPDMWMWTILIIVTAVAGKVGGTTVAARAAGIAWREALALGALMNTRGLMELVALNIGLDVGVISTSVYSMMVLMAVFTTLMTGPLLSLLYRSKSESESPAPSIGSARSFN